VPGFFHAALALTASYRLWSSSAAHTRPLLQRGAHILRELAGILVLERLMSHWRLFAGAARLLERRCEASRRRMLPACWGYVLNDVF
jgi:hypothetical protein